MDILVDNERMNSIIEFWQKKYADAEKELECSINLRKQIQNDLLKSDRLNDKLEAENAELKAENERLKEEADNWRKLFEQQVKFNAKQQKLWVQRCTENHNEDSRIIDKYKQTLQEIKAIAEDNIDCTQYEIDHDCFNNTRCKALREQIEILQQILDLITKAEEE